MKVSTCLWSGKDVEEAVRFYVALVPGALAVKKNCRTMSISEDPFDNSMSGR